MLYSVTINQKNIFLVKEDHYNHNIQAQLEQLKLQYPYFNNALLIVW